MDGMGRNIQNGIRALEGEMRIWNTIEGQLFRNENSFVEVNNAQLPMMCNFGLRRTPVQGCPRMTSERGIVDFLQNILCARTVCNYLRPYAPKCDVQLIPTLNEW